MDERKAQEFEEMCRNMGIINENRKEVYKLSKLLPVDEGYKLLELFDDSLQKLDKEWHKIYKSST